MSTHDASVAIAAADDPAGDVGPDVAATIAHMVRAIDRATLETWPFDHIYLDEAFPPALYRRMLEMLPDARFFRDLRKRESMRPDGSSARRKFELLPEFIARLPRVQRRFWNAVAEAVNADPVRLAFVRKFDGSLRRRFAREPASVGLFPIPMLLCDTAGYRISIHSDTLRKGITVQAFMPRGESQRHLGTVFHELGPDGKAHEATRMAFLPNSLYAFPVTEHSFHSLGSMTEADGERRSLMLTYYVEQGLADRLRRYGKRLANAVADRVKHPFG